MYFRGSAQSPQQTPTEVTPQRTANSEGGLRNGSAAAGDRWLGGLLGSFLQNSSKPGRLREARKWVPAADKSTEALQKSNSSGGASGGSAKAGSKGGVAASGTGAGGGGLVTAGVTSPVTPAQQLPSPVLVPGATKSPSPTLGPVPAVAAISPKLVTPKAGAATTPSPARSVSPWGGSRPWTARTASTARERHRKGSIVSKVTALAAVLSLAVLSFLALVSKLAVGSTSQVKQLLLPQQHTRSVLALAPVSLTEISEALYVGHSAAKRPLSRRQERNRAHPQVLRPAPTMDSDRSDQPGGVNLKGSWEAQGMGRVMEGHKASASEDETETEENTPGRTAVLAVEADPKAANRSAEMWAGYPKAGKDGEQEQVEAEERQVPHAARQEGEGAVRVPEEIEAKGKGKGKGKGEEKGRGKGKGKRKEKAKGRDTSLEEGYIPGSLFSSWDSAERVGTSDKFLRKIEGCPELPDPGKEGVFPVHYPLPKSYERQECRCTPVHNFVILSMQRSGSGWFETFLNSHPNVSSFGEIFGKSRGRRANVSDLLGTIDQIYNLDWRNSASKNSCVSAVGFKWMLNQGAMAHHQAVAHYLRQNHVSVILLVRRNVLRRLISILANGYDRKMRLINGRHKSHVHTKEEAKKLAQYRPRIGVKHLMGNLQRVQEIVDDAVRAFNRTRLKVVSYEEVVRDPKILDDIQRTLGVPVTRLQSKQVKIHTKPLKESIENYWEVVRKLRGTPLEFVLNDDPS